MRVKELNSMYVSFIVFAMGSQIKSYEVVTQHSNYCCEPSRIPNNYQFDDISIEWYL